MSYKAQVFHAGPLDNIFHNSYSRLLIIVVLCSYALKNSWEIVC